MKCLNGAAFMAATTLVLSGGMAAAQDNEYPDFGDVTLTVVGDEGQNMAAFDQYADELAKAGITIEKVGTTFTGLYDRLKTDFVAGSSDSDLVLFYPSYLGDFAGNGYLEPLNDLMDKEPASIWSPKLDQVQTAYEEVYLKWDGQTYALPYDGDVLNMYFRKDLFNNEEEQAAFEEQFGRELTPPETWDEWLEVAEFFTREEGDTLAGETLDKPFYGTATYGARGFSYAWFLARFASTGGVYFDDDMNPLINSDAAVESLQKMVDVLPYSPPDVLGYGYEELKNTFLDGNVAMVIQWSDVGKKTADPEVSEIVGKAGFGLVPGTEIDGKVNHRAPMPVGRVLAVPESSENKEAAYWVAKFLSLDKSQITVGANWSGQDPYREAHFTDLSHYPFEDQEVAQAWADATMANLRNGFPDLNIPGAAEYNDALDLAVNKALSGQLEPKAALDGAAEEWEAINQRLGADNQKQFWEQALSGYRDAGLLD